jgi:hypothetical protein
MRSKNVRPDICRRAEKTGKFSCLAVPEARRIPRKHKQNKYD